MRSLAVSAVLACLAGSAAAQEAMSTAGASGSPPAAETARQIEDWIAASPVMPEEDVLQGLARPRDGALVQQCGAGLLSVRIAEDGGRRVAAVRSPRGQERARHAAPLPAGLDALAAAGTDAALWDNGPRWWLVEAASAAALRAFRPDFAALAAWTNATHATGVAAFAAEADPAHQLAVRAFCPGDAVNVPEDPVTGSANAVVAAWLHAQGRLPGGGDYIASQGRELGRDGRVAVRVDDAGEVWIGGHVQQVIDGTLDW